jgi:hypothetical protein
LLSAAAFVWSQRVRLCIEVLPTQQPLRLSPHDAGASATLQLLVLLVQQLQGLGPEARTAFLHSPAGSNVLQVLSSMVEQGMVSGGTGCGDQSVPIGRSQDGDGCMQLHSASRDQLVSLLLLPGLLLQPTASRFKENDVCSYDKYGVAINAGSGEWF